MTIFFIIMGVLFFLDALIKSVFIFAIWRAILGKSSVDSKLGVAITALGKKMDGLSDKMKANTDEQGDVAKQIKELAREIRKAKEE